jgi:pSer/pThr/pTyr-binding forkhead associated (FHA) protein
MNECPTCGAEIEMSRLTGILGSVCRACDGFNEPGNVTCVSCGQPLPARGAAPVLATPRTAGEAPEAPAPLDLPPIDFEAVLVDAPDPEAGVAGVLLPGPPGLALSEPDLVPAEPDPLPVEHDLWTAQHDLVPPEHDLLPAEHDLAPPEHDLLPADPIPAEETVHTVDPIDLVDPVAGLTPLDPVPLRAPPRAAPPPLPFESVELEPEPRTPAPPAPSASPAPPPPQRTATGRCELVLERGDGREGATFPVEGEESPVGRADGSLGFPGDPSLAPRHATFLRRSGRIYVRDEGAPGGTFLRLRGLTVPLRPGDAFAVGDRLLRFAGPLPAAAPPAPDGTRRLGSPRPIGPGVLIEERLAGGTTGRVWLRAGPSVTLGRAGCSVNLGDDPFLSQAHAEVLLEGDGTARLRDLGSANGTFVRVPPRAERELRDGDLVRVGRQVLRVSLPAAREA